MREPRFQPVTLNDARLEQRGWRIGVVLEEFDVVAVVGQIEPAVERRRLGVPRPPNGLDRGRGNAELGKSIPVDDVLAGFETQPRPPSCSGCVSNPANTSSTVI